MNADPLYRLSLGAVTELVSLQIARSTSYFMQELVRSQLTTVSGVTMRRDCFQAEQTRRAITQKSEDA